MVDRALTETGPALALAGLSVRLADGPTVVDGVDLAVEPGEVLGIVGESGSGKTTTALALMGYASEGLRISGGTLQLDGGSVSMDESMRPLRGSTISYIPQDPARALNPSLRVRSSIRDVLRAHRRRRASDEETTRLLTSVGLGPECASRYPHELSGGQQQRVSIAMAISCSPRVVVLDEPTTGLDVVTQAKVIDELKSLRDASGVSMVYISHDLAVVGQLADQIVVMYAGRIVERGPAEVVLTDPRHPYTRGLIASSPDPRDPQPLQPMPGVTASMSERAKGCAFAPRCQLRTDECVADVPPLRPTDIGSEVRCVHFERFRQQRAVRTKLAAKSMPGDGYALQISDLSINYGSRHNRVVAADAVSFSVRRGTCLALVGESGSGKTSILRTVCGLQRPSAGQMLFNGAPLAYGARARSPAELRSIQMIAQNPASALNPRQTVEQAIGRPLRVFRGVSGDDVRNAVAGLLERVRLSSEMASRYPRQLSGGERQRVAIARALAAEPELLLCDEVTSALDVSVQAVVLELLNELRVQLGLSVIFITHDLGVVRQIADEVVVLRQGCVVEAGATDHVLTAPEHEYTRGLLDAAPSLATVAQSRLERSSGRMDGLM